MKAIIMIGAQGAGKSTFTREILKQSPSFHVVSRDAIRGMIFPPDRTFQQCFYLEPAVTQIQNISIDCAISLGKNVLIDETSYTRVKRRYMMNYLKGQNPAIKLHAVIVMADLKLCMVRNALRTGKALVPDEVIKECYTDLLASLGGSWNEWSITEQLTAEGFDEITFKYTDNFEGLQP